MSSQNVMRYCAQATIVAIQGLQIKGLVFGSLHSIENTERWKGFGISSEILFLLDLQQWSVRSDVPT